MYKMLKTLFVSDILCWNSGEVICEIKVFNIYIWKYFTGRSEHVSMKTNCVHTRAEDKNFLTEG